MTHPRLSSLSFRHDEIISSKGDQIHWNDCKCGALVLQQFDTQTPLCFSHASVIMMSLRPSFSKVMSTIPAATLQVEKPPDLMLLSATGLFCSCFLLDLLFVRGNTRLRPNHIVSLFGFMYFCLFIITVPINAAFSLENGTMSICFWCFLLLNDMCVRYQWFKFTLICLSSSTVIQMLCDPLCRTRSVSMFILHLADMYSTIRCC